MVRTVQNPVAGYTFKMQATKTGPSMDFVFRDGHYQLDDIARPALLECDALPEALLMGPAPLIHYRSKFQLFL